MTRPDFGRTYDYIYKVASQHSVPDCRAVMDAAVRIYLDEKERYLKTFFNENISVGITERR